MSDVFAPPRGGGSWSDAAPGVLSVSQLNHGVAEVLNRAVPTVWVGGEVSNLSCAASGHWYFTLKDPGASVRAVMFRGRNQAVGFVPRNGERVELRAQVTLYEARGDFQLSVELMRRVGAGDLYAQFAQLKARLAADGLFDAARKRPLPAAPQTVGVVTSLQAAALRDVLITLARRAPQVAVVLYPAAVQGTQAAAELVAALQAAARRRECQVLLLVRGGGSMEDLWSFNDETLARTLAAMPMPVISGVGHETDFTIADAVADWRAATPTAAAAAAVPDRQQLQLVWQRLVRQAAQAWLRLAQQHEQRLDWAVRSLRPPSVHWAEQGARLERLVQRLQQVFEQQRFSRAATVQSLLQRVRPPEWRAHQARYLAALRALGVAGRAHRSSCAKRLAHAQAALEWVSPHAVLGRGYAMVRTVDGQIARDATQLVAGQHVAVTLAHGAFQALVLPFRADAGSSVTRPGSASEPS